METFNFHHLIHIHQVSKCSSGLCFCRSLFDDDFSTTMYNDQACLLIHPSVYRWGNQYFCQHKKKWTSFSVSPTLMVNVWRFCFLLPRKHSSCLTHLLGVLPYYRLLIIKGNHILPNIKTCLWVQWVFYHNFTDVLIIITCGKCVICRPYYSKYTGVCIGI